MSNNTNQKNFFFTSESVGAGHPDKVADQISDAVLDALLAVDPNSRVAAETLCTTGLVVLAGEITSLHPRVKDKAFYTEIVRKTLRSIGYTNPAFGIDADTCEVIVRYDGQSPDIAQGVDSSFDNKAAIGAGDQGIMFGYACNETPQMMPLAITIAHDLMKKQEDVRKHSDNAGVPVLRPDAKSQVTLEYRDGKAYRIDTIVLSTQHIAEISIEDLREFVIDCVIKPVINRPEYEQLNKGDIKFLVNPTGRFVVGGPEGDCGLTGRKIIVDTYGGAAPHGGGAFSGKDATKVDRSAAYAARHVAKHVVSAGIAERCLVQLSYAIGVAAPTSIMVDTFGTGKVADEKIAEAIINEFDLTPAGIIEKLNLRQPIFQQTAAYGHFGKAGLPWEDVYHAGACNLRDILGIADPTEDRECEECPA